MTYVGFLEKIEILVKYVHCNCVHMRMDTFYLDKLDKEVIVIFIGDQHDSQ